MALSHDHASSERPTPASQQNAITVIGHIAGLDRIASAARHASLPPITAWQWKSVALADVFLVLDH